MQMTLSSFIAQVSTLQNGDEIGIQQTDHEMRVVGEAVYPIPSAAHTISKAVMPVFQAFKQCCRSVFHVDAPFSLPVRDPAIFLKITRYIEEAFGEKRFHRVLTALHLTMTKLEWRGYGLTKSELASCLQVASFVHTDDVEELLQELHGESAYVRRISGEDLTQLKARFRDKRKVTDCSTDDLDVLVGLLDPCSTLKDVLLGESYDDSLSVDSVLSCRPYERAAVAHFHLKHKKDLTEEEWAIIFLKRLTMNPLRQGLLLRAPTGYLMYTDTVETGGASKWFLKSLAPDQLHSKIIYRGTRGALISPQLIDSFLSIREDLTTEMGSNGIMETFEATKSLLTDPNKGFVRFPDEQVDLYGYSLGGAQAMRDCVLFEKNVHKLITLCSPGVDLATAKLFSEKMKQRTSTIDVTHLIDADDFCHNFGEALIGASCANTAARVRVICQIPLSKEPYVFPLAHTSMKGVADLTAAVGKGILAHVRVTPYDPYRARIVASDEPELLEKCLLHDREYYDSFWEGVRQGVVLAHYPFHEFARKAS